MKLRLSDDAGDCYCVMNPMGHNPEMHADKGLPDFYIEHHGFYFGASNCTVCFAMKREMPYWQKPTKPHVHVYHQPQFEVPKIDRPKPKFKTNSLEDEEEEGEVIGG